ncbi:hypothetical protein KIV66_gp32 [Mycobacterium phage MyraDee]|uniref:DUF2510 domain-containing protein n=1 Tax=Mycobacterium phage MyraDee TaxID=2024303 RepID=A0A222YZB6_9CAUD|nr:hypothetical protein KIV66_gp32 [Mycobacterium phage MyraDee]ASR77140.1 hypothetical protein SEA_MYRADEE_32 [Mycobacterium phage MyraDee]
MTVQPIAEPGWYPDPTGREGRRWFNGFEWTQAEGETPLPPPSVAARPAKKPLNAFFVVLAFLSALPTLYWFAVFIEGGGQNAISAFVTLWCGMWTYVWWSLRHR